MSGADVTFLVPVFRQSHDFVGIATSIATIFAAATRKTVNFVARAMEGRQTRVT